MAKQEKIQFVIKDGEFVKVKAGNAARQLLQDNKIKTEIVVCNSETDDEDVYESIMDDELLRELNENMVTVRHCTKEAESALRKEDDIPMPVVKCVRHLNEDTTNCGENELTSEMAYDISDFFLTRHNSAGWNGRGIPIKGVDTKGYEHILPLRQYGNETDCIDIWFAKNNHDRQKWRIVVEVNGRTRVEVYRTSSVFALAQAIKEAWNKEMTAYDEGEE